jgi:hypothetical protein
MRPQVDIISNAKASHISAITVIVVAVPEGHLLL